MNNADEKDFLEHIIAEINNTDFQLDTNVGKFEFIKYLRKKYLEP